jgi:hypothetical protein
MKSKKPPARDYDPAIRNFQIEEMLNDIGRVIGAQMPPGWGFSLLIASHGEGGGVFYISNLNRDDMIATMQEFIAKNQESKT